MSEIMIHDISADTFRELQNRAQQNRRSIDAEAAAIIEEELLRSKYKRIATEQGLGSALQAIGREFNITDEFDNLRDPDKGMSPRP